MKDETQLIKFQYYDGDISRPVPIGFISLSQFIERHQNPSEKIMKVFDDIDDAARNGNNKLKDELKQQNLFYFTPSAIFRERFHRRYDNITSFTGLAQIDIDDLDHQEAIDLKYWLFENYEEMYCAYLSPSRKGVKALVRIPIAKSIDDFKKYYKALEDEFEWLPGFDPAPKNLALPLFLSYDTDILWRPSAKVWDRTAELQPKELENLKDTPPPKPLADGDESVYKSNAYFRKITLDIYDRKINAISDNGHPQLRGASLVLGSRVGAGYLTQSDAEQFAEWCIRNSSYLSKGIEGYVKTMRWAIKQGIKNPKYYD